MMQLTEEEANLLQSLTVHHKQVRFLFTFLNRQSFTWGHKVLVNLQNDIH